MVTGTPGAARDLLASYADTYLREEVQAEALVRNLGGFARFLDVVAAENGGVVVAEVPEPYRLGDVDILPYRVFLDQLLRLVR